LLAASRPAQARLVKSVAEIGRLRMRFPITAKVMPPTAGVVAAWRVRPALPGAAAVRMIG
jgi:hypothetical protein